jgi:hypothetical protein
VRTCWLSIPLVLLALLSGISLAGLAAEPAAKIVVDSDEYPFGVLSVGDAGQHDFTITNAGAAMLLVYRGKSTCGCCTCVCKTIVPETGIAPGKSAKVRLEWISRVYSGPYRQTETLKTNDPKRPEVMLQVWGRYGSPLRAVPDALGLGQVPLGQPGAAEVRLYNYLKQPLAIAGWELADRATADRFEVTCEPLPKAAVNDEAMAQGGCLVRVRLKPGLPLGAFQQQLRLKTNLATMPLVEIPVQGEVTNEISIVGRGWDGRRGVLTLGNVDGRQGTECRLLLVARGAGAAGIQLKTTGTTPPWLKVEVGRTAPGQDGASSHTPLVLRIPPGTGPAAHLGDGQGEPGQVVLRTGHPRVPEVRIVVRFAVR